MNRALRWLAIRFGAVPHGTSLSFRGAFFVFGTTLIGLAAVDAGINLLLMIFGLCLAACMISFFAGWRILRRLSIKRTAPDAITAGQQFEMRYTVKNLARWGCARSIHLTESPDEAGLLSPIETFIPRLRPGESVIVSIPAAARMRGRVRMSTIRLSTEFPFGVFGKAVVLRHDHELVVYPTLGKLLSDVKSSSRSAEAFHTGGAPSRVKGDEEYYGVREYRAGDNPRRIHWRRTAQTGRLMIREMAKTRDLKFWCVLDTRVNPRDPADAQRLETAISAAATLVCDALEKGVKVGLVCSGELPVILPPGGGRAHRPRLLRELALRAKNPEDDLASAVQRVAWPNRWRGACYLFAAHDCDDLRNAARALNFALGATTVLTPGSTAFESMFLFPSTVSRPATKGSARARA